MDILRIFNNYGMDFKNLNNKIIRVITTENELNTIEAKSNLQNSYRGFQILEVLSREDLNLRDRVLDNLENKLIIISKQSVGNTHLGSYFKYTLIRDDFKHACEFFNVNLKRVKKFNFNNIDKKPYYKTLCKLTTQLKTEYLNYVDMKDSKVTHIAYIEYSKIPITVSQMLTINNQIFEILGYQNVNEENVLYEIYLSEKMVKDETNNNRHEERDWRKIS